MFHKMRRFNQQMTEKECIEILKSETNGVLAVSGDSNYPYAVPLSFVYTDNKIYFHSATTGHKIDSIKSNPKVSFCVVKEDNIVPEKFTTFFKSVIVFGNARLVDDEREKIEALILLAKKYSPNETHTSISHEINSFLKNVTIIKLNCEHITGKKAKELL